MKKTELIESIEVGDTIFDVNDKEYKVVNIMHHFDPFTLNPVKVILIDWYGQERRIKNEDIVRVEKGNK